MMSLNPPKTIAENIKFRRDVYLKCRPSAEAQSLMRAYCKDNILFFFNTWLWAEDPFIEKGLRHGVESMRVRPIVTYPFQDDFVLELQSAIRKGEDFIRDKSRDMLATYMVLGVYIHGWLFHSQKHMITSWKEDEIDGKDDTSTHFGKLRFNLKRFPLWLLPEGFDWKKNSSYMKLQNPESGATLTGSAATASLASGRREDSIFMDELSKWEKHDSEAWKSASDATRCKIGIWTPHGSGNKAAQLMLGTEVKNKGHLYWWLHPEKTFTTEAHLESVKRGEVYDKVRKYVVTIGSGSPPPGCYIDQYGRIRSEWYDRECQSRSADDIAENLDCDYLTTGRPIFDTNICALRRNESVPPKLVGDLVWKIHPVFTEMGECYNRDQLSVEFVPNPNGRVYIWEEPRQGFSNAYCAGADTAEGLEQGDFDAAYVLFRGERPKVVARLHGHIRIHEYAEELAKLGVYYKFAYINVERNNHGHGVILQLLKIYSRLWHKEVFTKGYAEATDQVGFTTGSNTKPILIGTLGKAISMNEVDIPDERFWSETITFVEEDGRMQAQGKHRGERCYDDCVMSFAITLWTHLNMPLPAQLRIDPEIPKWRRDRRALQQKKSLVGWVVNA